MHAMPAGVGRLGYAKVRAISEYPHSSGLTNEDPEPFFKRLRRRLVLKNGAPNIWTVVGVERLVDDGTAKVWAESQKYDSKGGEWERSQRDLVSRFWDMRAKDRRLGDFLRIARAHNESLNSFVSGFQNSLGRLATTLDKYSVLNTL